MEDGAVHGVFTLDRPRAREKMQKFQLANPRTYVLELVQAAVLLGATRIHFEVDARDLRMQFDGPSLDRRVLSDLDVALMQGEGGPGRHQLALGLACALGLEPQSVVVESGDVRLTLQPGQPDRLEPLGEHRAGTRILVRDRLHPRLLVKLLAGSREEDFLVQRCAWSRVPIHLDGRRITLEPEDFTRLALVTVRGDGIEGWGGVRADGEPELLLHKDGVLIETVRLEMGAIPFSAVVDGRDLRKDVSGAAIVRDGSFQAVMDAVAAARRASIPRLHDHPLSCGDALPLLARAIQDELFAVPTLEALEGDPRTYPACLAHLEAWPTVTGDTRRTTFHALRSGSTLGFLPYATEMHPGLELPGARHVLLGDWAMFEKLNKRLDGQTRNVTRRLRGLVTGQQNRERWRARPARPRLEDRGLVARRPIRCDGVTGEVGLRPLQAQALVALIKDGCVLHVLYPDGWPKGIEARLTADFAPPPTYDGVRRDALFARALLATIQALPELYDEAARAWRPHPVAADLLRVLARDEPLPALLEGCGLSPAAAREAVAREPALAWKPPDVGADSDSPLLRVPWLPCGRAHLSLQAMRQRAQDGPLRWVAPTNGVTDRTCLRLTESERAALAWHLGATALEPAEAEPRAQPVERPTVHEARDEAPEESLAMALRAELHRMHAGNPDLLWDLKLGQVGLSSETAAAAVVASTNEATLQLGHPLVRRALKDFSEDPLILVLLTSVLYSAINQARAEVTDVDEDALQDALVEYVLAGSAAAGVRASDAAAPAPPTGFVDPIARLGVCTGWVMGESTPVRFFVDGDPRRGQYAGSATPGPAGPDGRRAFEFAIPDRFLDGMSRSLWAVITASESTVHHALSGSPRKFTSKSRWPASPIGWLDSVDAAGVACGWALDPTVPEKAIGIHFYLDGEPGQGEFVGGLSADLPRPDCNEALGHPGAHGFRFPIPPEHLDGSRHVLYAYGIDAEGGHNPQLNGSPQPFGG